MKRDNLDNIDVKILKTLQENGRVTNVELAEKVDLSAPPCLRRVRSLEDKGFIKGYHADLSAEKLGFLLLFLLWLDYIIKLSQI